jgi:hypothetical protein
VRSLAVARAKLAARTGEKPPSKLRNRWTTCKAGHKHQSAKEAGRCGELILWEKAGLIEGLNRKVRFHLLGDWWYESDFTYHWPDEDHMVIEDVKGRRDKADLAYRLFRLKADLVKAVYGIEVTET